MIKLVVKNGVQTITEICDICKCHCNDLEITDIITKVNHNGMILKDENGNILEAKEPRGECKCESCND